MSRVVSFVSLVLPLSVVPAFADYGPVAWNASGDAVYTFADGRHELARVTWTRLDDGTVHHVIERSRDEGKTWQPAFDAIYVRSDREVGG